MAVASAAHRKQEAAQRPGIGEPPVLRPSTAYCTARPRQGARAPASVVTPVRWSGPVRFLSRCGTGTSRKAVPCVVTWPAVGGAECPGQVCPCRRVSRAVCGGWPWPVRARCRRRRRWRGGRVEQGSQAGLAHCFPLVDAGVHGARRPPTVRAELWLSRHNTPCWSAKWGGSTPAPTPLRGWRQAVATTRSRVAGKPRRRGGW